MKTNKLKTLVMGTTIGLMLLAGVGSTTALAQRRVIVRPRPVIVYRHGPFFGPYWNRTVTVVDPIAQARESGYSDGHSRGKDDAKKGKPESPDSHKHFTGSDSQTYREAFLQGYSEGYREQMDRRG